MNIHEVAKRRRIHLSEVFERAKEQWRKEANAIADYTNFIQTGVLPGYVLAFVDCEARKMGAT